MNRRSFLKTLALSLSAVPVIAVNTLDPLHWVRFDSSQKAHIIDSEGRVLKLPATLVEGNKYRIVLDK